MKIEKLIMKNITDRHYWTTREGNTHPIPNSPQPMVTVLWDILCVTDNQCHMFIVCWEIVVLHRIEVCLLFRNREFQFDPMIHL